MFRKKPSYKQFLAFVQTYLGCRAMMKGVVAEL